MGSPCSLDGFTTASPRPPGPHLATRHSHLQEGHFLAVPTKMWVGQRRFWEKLINTSSCQLGLEIRAPETGQGIAVSVHASQPVHAGSRKPYLGNFREDITENCGVGAWRAVTGQPPPDPGGCRVHWKPRGARAPGTRPRGIGSPGPQPCPWGSLRTRGARGAQASPATWRGGLLGAPLTRKTLCAQVTGEERGHGEDGRPLTHQRPGPRTPPAPPTLQA